MYAIVDIECNGAPFHQEKMTEIAIYRFDGHRVVDQMISLVNPEEYITPFVQKLTGITPKMVQRAPKFHELARRILEITEEATIVGHNVTFDYRILRQSFHALGYEYKRATIDTLPLAKKMIPGEESYSLGKLCHSVGIPLSDRHRASGDARATVDLFKLLLSKDQAKKIIQNQQSDNLSELCKKIIRLTEFLPSESGIIYFQNQKGKILYADFNSNIYQTATKILNSGHKKWQKIIRETAKVQYDFTGTELIAKIIVSHRYNRKLPKLKFGLYYTDRYSIERCEQGKTAILKFKNLSQAKKALGYISKQERFKNNPQDLIAFLSLKNRQELWISKGREDGEKSFIIVDNGKISGFGYYKLYHQIESLEKINKLKIEIEENSEELLNELKLSLLREDYQIKKLPKK